MSATPYDHFNELVEPFVKHEDDCVLHLYLAALLRQETEALRARISELEQILCTQGPMMVNTIGELEVQLAALTQAHQQVTKDNESLRCVRDHQADMLNDYVAQLEKAQQAHQQAVTERDDFKATKEQVYFMLQTTEAQLRQAVEALVVAIHELECSGLAFDHPLLTRLKKALPPKFAVTSCSQCGQEFGPGESGYSHCDQHKATHKEKG